MDRAPLSGFSGTQRRFAFGATLLAAVALLAPSAPAAAQQSGWQQGPGAVGDNTYDGYIDVPGAGSTVSQSSSILVGGWMVDKAAQGWAGFDGVQVVNGTLGSGGTVLASSGIVGQNRPDVGNALGNSYLAASGFSAVIPAGALNPGTYTIAVYGHTPGKGSWYKTTSITVAAGGGASAGGGAPAPGPSGGGGKPTLTITEPVPQENISTQRSDFTAYGSAYDPNAPHGSGQSVDRVQVYLNGDRESGTYLGDATISGSDWSLTFVPTHYPSQHSVLYVYARSKSSGQETLTTQEFNIVDRSS